MIATVPFAFISLQMAAASHTEYGVALTCLAVGAFHLALGNIARKSERAGRLGCPYQFFLVYCIIFSNLAIPFTFRQASASAIWAAEGAFLTAFAVKKKRDDALACGLLLHAAAFVIYNYGPYLHLPARLYDTILRPAGLLDWRSETSPFLLTGLIFAASALVSSRFLSGAPADLTPGARIRGHEFKLPHLGLAYFFAVYGTMWWTLSVWHAAFVAFDGSGVTAFSILCLGGAAGYALSSAPWRKAGGASWDAAGVLAFPPLAAAFVGVLSAPAGPSILEFSRAGSSILNVLPGLSRDLWSGFGLNWPAFAVMFALGVLSRRSAAPTRFRSVTWGLALFSFVSYTAVVWQFWANDVSPPAWNGPGGAGYFAAFLPLYAAAALLTRRRSDGSAVPGAYLDSTCAALFFMLLLRLPAFIDAFKVAPNVPPFYIPLLNTLELRQLLYLGTAAMLLRALPSERARRTGLHCVLAFAVFILLNNVAARSALRYFDERVSWGYMSRAPYFQGIITILWGTASLACIFGGKKYRVRPLWFMGAGLLALDILKLLAIDLRNSATIIRICAFLLLGGFFLLIGWAAPLPPPDTRPDERSRRAR
jgi:uncharacterized membrane protein